ncbi:hypothetical protein [uncultured Nostoc sp.]|uniref:hypothetical protein n=1 Tax=uncultured Nostoc sp. TaxID=340711 RepID=UPI0035CA0E43
MKILDHKDAINRRQDEELIIVETAIYRVSCLNRTVLIVVLYIRMLGYAKPPPNLQFFLLSSG